MAALTASTCTPGTPAKPAKPSSGCIYSRFGAKPLYSPPEEQALLALTEEVTLIGQHVSDATYEQAAALFDEQYLAQAIMAIVTINAWNRIAISTQLPVEADQLATVANTNAPALALT